MDNLGNPAATPKKAPSNAAWAILKAASLEKDGATKFISSIYRPLRTKDAEGAGEEWKRAEVETFELLDQFEALNHCPHCGKEL